MRRIEQSSSDEHFSIDGTLLDALGLAQKFYPQGWRGSPSDDSSRNSGREKVSGQFRFVAAIDNLVRIGSLTG